MSSSSRFARASVVFGVAAALCVGWPAGAALAGGSPSAPAGSQTALQAQAQEVAAQIQADGQRVDQLDEAYNGAEIRNQQLASQGRTLEAARVQSQAQATLARQQLKAQAVLAYMSGGGPVVPFQSGRPGSDPSLTLAYDQILSGGAQRAEQEYQGVLAAQNRQARQLATERNQAAATAADVQADVTTANQTMAAEQHTLTQVKGQLSVLVAQAQAAQQQAEQTAEEAALASQGQLPAVNGGSPSPSGSTATTTRPTSGGTTTPTTDPGPTTTTTVPSGPTDPTQAPGASQAISYARAQLGKPYQWAGAGPNSFDCSGLVMMAWEQAGIYFPHLAQDQYNLTARIPLSDLLPGDLVFFGTPDDVYHVGLYIGGGNMIDAPETGQNVSIQSIYESNLLGAGRVTSQS